MVGVREVVGGGYCGGGTERGKFGNGERFNLRFSFLFF